MNISNYTKYDYNELGKEIEKTKAKIRNLQDQIKLLEKLQVAELANSDNSSENGELKKWK